MGKSRLNKRINHVSDNIAVKIKLLKKLKKTKHILRNKNVRKRQTRSNNTRLNKYRGKHIHRPFRKRTKIMPFNIGRNLHNKNVRKRSRKMPINKIESQQEINNEINYTNDPEPCLIKNVHEEMVEVPYRYPGDLWVHNNLEFNRDKPLEYFNEEDLKSVYSKYRKICFGN